MLGYQLLGQGDDILRLGVKQADRLDVPFQLLLAQRDHLLGREHFGEQQPRSLVHANIGGLCR